MKCTVSAMQIRWSCNEYFLQYCYIFVQFAVKYGVGINKIYCTVKHSGGGLGITKYAKFKCFNGKNDKLIGIVLFNSSFMYGPCIYIVCYAKEMFVSHMSLYLTCVFLVLCSIVL